MKFVNSWATIFLILVLLQQSMKEIGADLISNNCKKPHDSGLCQKSLRSDPRGARARDAKELTHVMYGIVLSSATTTLAQVKKLLTRTKGDALPMCSSIYGRIVNEKVPNAYRNFDSKSYVTAASVMTDVMNQAEACEMMFESLPDHGKSPITDKNNMVMALSKIASQLTTHLA
jgi:pectinesterase inhibitor-like protein